VLGKANVAIISKMKTHCVLGFFKGALLSDPESVLEIPGPNTQSSRFMRFTSLDQIHAMTPLIKATIAEAIDIEQRGLKVSFKPIHERQIPDELLHQFRRVDGLRSAFEALTPGRRRAYLMHFSSAKQSATRTARIERCIQQIFDGKGLNER
jgi:uncharacterized protein YdeI (YjbR/CyaY-like superfamily)